MEVLYKAYKDNRKVAFYLIYVREAHPASKASETSDHRGVARHQTIDSKVLAASKCLTGLKLSLPCLIDSLEGKVEKAYQGRPAATAVVDINGKVVFCARGPRGVQPERVRTVLERLLPSQAEPSTQLASMPASRPATGPAAGATTADQLLPSESEPSTQPAGMPASRPATGPVASAPAADLDLPEGPPMP